MLTAGQVEKVKFTLAGSGWTDVMRPAIQQRANEALKALALDPSERAKIGGEFKDLEDKDLRAIIRECQWMLVVWVNEVNVFEMNRRSEEIQRQQNGPGMEPDAHQAGLTR
jgi:hypothetical protein